jgi:DNA-directed RNA polymerase
MDMSLEITAYDTNAEREAEMVENGKFRHLRSEKRAVEGEQVSQAGRRVLTEAMPNLVEALQKEFVATSATVGRPAAHFHALDLIEFDVLAHVILSHMTRKASLASMDEPERASMSDLFTALGDDVRQLTAEGAWKRASSKEYRAAIAKMPKSKAKRKEAALEVQQRFPVYGEEADVNVAVAGGLVAIAMEVTNMFSTFDHKAEDAEWPEKCICFTAEAEEIIANTTEDLQYDHPEFQAMLVPPAPWTSFDTGAYLDARVARKNPLVNGANKVQREAINAAIQADAPFIQAVNSIQAVPYAINTWIVKLVEHFNRKKIAIGKDGDTLPGAARPIDWKAEDKKKLAEDLQFNKSINGKRHAIKRDIEEALRLSNEAAFYEPAYLDFRSRVYPRCNFNHQGSDVRKAMFLLKNGEVLTEEGIEELKWHVGTTGPGGVDKSPDADRIQWVNDNMALIRSIVADPKATVDDWTLADSPFCFLAAAKSLVDVLNDPTTLCGIPVARDGSCSGLQHFSAILRDPEGAKHVNLIPSERPQDVYRAVAGKTAAVVAKDAGDSIADLWMTFGINRTLCKRNTMTYGYGSEAGGMSKQLWEDFLKKEGAKRHFGDDGKFRREAGTYLAKINFESIKQTVPGAEACKTFFRAISKELSAANLPSSWFNPTGFPVISTYYEPTFKVVNSFAWEGSERVRYQPKLLTGYTKKIAKNDQKLGISPNFIHSCDAAHVHSVANKAVSEGITDFMFIHDSFATTPNRMVRFKHIIRETFVEMYENNDPLQSLLDNAKGLLKVRAESVDAEDAKDVMKLVANLEKLEVPQRGSLDLKVVLDSKYAFA